MVNVVDGTMTIKTDRARELFYADCAEADARWATEQLGSHPMDSIAATVDRPAWRSVPTTYVCCEQDATLTRDYMHAAIERVGNGVHWPTSHSPMLSRPDLVADLLTSLAPPA
jgi:pimeloyl-ACP methyl ester carboxylesterase